VTAIAAAREISTGPPHQTISRERASKEWRAVCWKAGTSAGVIVRVAAWIGEAVNPSATAAATTPHPFRGRTPMAISIAGLVAAISIRTGRIRGG